MTEFKTKEDYDIHIKGDEYRFSNKTISGEHRLFTCNECLSHFDDKEERNTHLRDSHNITTEFDGHPSYDMGDSDFKNGGKVF